MDRPIAFQRSFVRITGSINAALLLSQAVYWSSRTLQGDGWFWKTRADWEEETGLSRYEQEGARKLLRAKGVLLEELRDNPAKLYFRIDEKVLRRLLVDCPSAMSVGDRVDAEPSNLGRGKPANKVGENSPTRRGKTSQLAGGKPACKLGGNQPSLDTETTSETTQRDSATASRLQLVSPVGSKKAVSDPRHTPCRDACRHYAEAHGVLPIWGPAEAKQLKLLLDSAPGLTVAGFNTWLQHKSDSMGVAHGEPPRIWLATLGRYQQGPLNQFNKREDGGADGASVGSAGQAGLFGRGASRGRTGGNLDALARAVAIAEQRESDIDLQGARVAG